MSGGSPFQPGGTQSVELARNQAPGPGLLASTRMWCFRCGEKKPRTGGTYVARLFKCADCKGPARK